MTAEHIAIHLAMAAYALLAVSPVLWRGYQTGQTHAVLIMIWLVVSVSWVRAIVVETGGSFSTVHWQPLLFVGIAPCVAVLAAGVMWRPWARGAEPVGREPRQKA